MKPSIYSKQNRVTPKRPNFKKTSATKKILMAGALLAAMSAGNVASAYTITGTVFLAPNGLPLRINNQVNGTPLSSIDGQSLYVYIINQSENIIARAQVINGTYSIPNLVAGQAAAAQLSSNFYAVGGKASFIGLPSAYYPIGEGDQPAGDLTPDYSFPLAQTADIRVDFAFEERPNSVNTIISTYNWNSYQRLIIPTSTFNGSDPEDGNYNNNLAGRTLDFYPATPATSTKLYYYDTLLNFATAGSKITVTNFNPTKVSLEYTGNASTRGFSYTVADNAGVRPYVPTTVSTTTPLLIDLISFTGAMKGDAAILNWSTASEKANEYFVIERSSDGIAFSNIGKVMAQSKGNSDAILSYSYTDMLSQSKLNGVYYRLRAVDNTGESTISHTLYMRTNNESAEGTQTWNVYPNPATDYLTLSTQNALKAPVNIIVTNATGAVLIHQSMSDSKHMLDLRQLPNGQYFLQLNGDNGESYKQQITVVR